MRHILDRGVPEAPLSHLRSETSGIHLEPRRVGRARTNRNFGIASVRTQLLLRAVRRLRRRVALELQL